VRMIDVHAYGMAAGYAAGSVVAGYLGIYLATASARRIRITA
jgi:hypothetical protein